MKALIQLSHIIFLWILIFFLNSIKFYKIYNNILHYVDMFCFKQTFFPKMSLTYLSFTLASIRPSKVSMLYTHKPDRASPKSHSWAPEIMLKLYVTNSLGQELYKNTDFFSNLLKPVDNFKFQFERSNFLLHPHRLGTTEMLSSTTLF